MTHQSEAEALRDAFSWKDGKMSGEDYQAKHGMEPIDAWLQAAQRHLESLEAGMVMVPRALRRRC